MKQSQLFTKTQKNAPKDEVSKNAQLLIRGGFIDKEMAGAYSFLPLGLKVLNKIIQIIREEMNALGGQEVTLTALQNPEIWQKTDRWDDVRVDDWFKTKLKNESELGLGFTHEEPLTQIMSKHISSYKDLPKYVYQFQTKFRNELRAKSGIMRTREFIMKDLYSFNTTQEEQDEFYEKSKVAYKNIFDRCGIGQQTFLTFASGGSFAKYSHEFQTICPAGEDIIYIDKEKKIAVNKEVYNDEVLKDLDLKKENLEEQKAIEVGNIFKLGTKFSEPLGLDFKDEKGQEHPVIMGSYGIGPARVMGTIVELNSDERGIVWPQGVAPFKVHLISLGKNKEAEKLYSDLQKQNIEVLFDDRDETAGTKFADADLLGLPYRVVVSEKTLDKDSVELKKRSEEKTELVKISDLSKNLK